MCHCQVLQSIAKRDQILLRLPASERYLATLLNHIQVIRRPHRPIILAEDYLLYLRKLIAAVKHYQQGNPDFLGDEQLHDLHLVVDWLVPNLCKCALTYKLPLTLYANRSLDLRSYMCSHNGATFFAQCLTVTRQHTHDTGELEN